MTERAASRPQAQAAVDVVRRWYEAITTGGGMSAPDLVADDADWRLMDGFPAGGARRGKDQVFDVYTPALMRAFEDIRAFPDALHALDDGRVLSLGHYRGRTHAGGAFDVPFAHLWTVADGRISALRQYTDTLLFAGAMARPHQASAP